MSMNWTLACLVQNQFSASRSSDLHTYLDYLSSNGSILEFITALVYTCKLGNGRKSYYRNTYVTINKFVKEIKWGYVRKDRETVKINWLDCFSKNLAQKRVTSIK